MDGPSYERDMKNAIKVAVFLIFAVGVALGLIFGFLVSVV